MTIRLSHVLAMLLGAAWNSAAGSEGEMVFPGEQWEMASPESQGLDPQRLDAAIEFLRQHSGPDGVKELVVIRNGRLVWKGERAEKVHGVWSCTKTFASTVLGLLIDDGKCSLDTLGCDHVSALRTAYPGVTLRHFTTMTSGYRAVGDEPRNGYTHGPSNTPFVPGPDPLFTPPGSQYAYWDSAMNEFGHVLTRVAGEPIEKLFRRRIAEPIGMNPQQWQWGDFGEIEGVVVNGGAGNHGRHVQVSVLEFARLGHLFLNRGKWNGRQLISAEWVAAATSTQVAASVGLGHKESGIDGRGVYGFNWWTNSRGPSGERKWPGATEGTFAASGYNNNDLFVIPEWQMVVVRLGLDEGQVKITDEVYGTFLKSIGEALSEPGR